VDWYRESEYAQMCLCARLTFRRKGTHYETSDSEGGPGPSTLKNAPKNKPNVPLVIEP
jgi:hypothetical protein